MKQLLFTLFLIHILGCSESIQYAGSEAADNHENKMPKALPALEVKELEQQLGKKNLRLGTTHILLRAFKYERKLELWVKSSSNPTYSYLKSWNFCTSSGDLGPKRQEGDEQIPEGIYHIDRFNPNSKFFLSLGLNYPNDSDKIRGHPQHPGSDIFIHGKCVTIGCIPITDLHIRELYFIAEQAKSNGQSQIPAMIFPFRMTEENMTDLGARYEQNILFWKELKVFFDFFEEMHEMPAFFIAPDGSYSLRE